MKKTIKFAAIFGFVFLAIGFISSLFFHNLGLIERLSSAIMLMTTVGFAEIQVPRVPGIICTISGAVAFLLFSVSIILCIVRLIIKKKKSPLLPIALLIFLSCSCSKQQDKEYYPDFEVPIYKNGIEIRTKSDAFILGKKLDYKLTNKISPNKIFDFYKTELSKIDFIENNKDVFAGMNVENNLYISHGKGNWGEPPIWLVKGWINTDKNTVFKLSLSYLHNAHLQVGILIHPYVNDPEALIFLKELKISGKEEEFFALYSKYPGKNHDIDLVSALKAEPNNNILKKYLIMNEKMKKQGLEQYNLFNQK